MQRSKRYKVLYFLDAGLQPTKSVFLRIDSCRVKMPAGELKQRFTQVEESLVAGLLIGWSPGWLKKSPQPHYVTLQSALGEARSRKQSAERLTASPQMYLKSVENNATVCRATVGKQSKSKKSPRTLEGVVDDLNLKFRDCYLYGMGRLVSMSVATDIDTTPDAG
jgi:hypothetical protein